MDPLEKKEEEEQYSLASLYGPEMSDESLEATRNRGMTAKENIGNLISGLFGTSEGSQALLEKTRQKRSEDVAALIGRRAEKLKGVDFARSQEAADPNSKSALIMRGMAKRFDPEGNYEGLTVAQMGPIVEEYRKGNLEAGKEKQRQAFELQKQRENIAGQKEIAGIERSTRAEERTNEKKTAAEEKKKTYFAEIEDRRQNINSALDTLDGMIQSNGTYEMFGSHNADMDRLVDQVATDMAKLQDPQSIARPAEVEMVKRTLVQPNMAKMTNATARQLLKNFRGEVERRANSAYKIRGVEVPVLPAAGGGTSKGSAAVLSDAEKNELAELRRAKAAEGGS